MVHNLADPAVARRIQMLTAFGDAVVPLGFHRGAEPVGRVAGIEAVDLGRTFDADFRQRIAQILRRSFVSSAWARQLRDCDIIIARNLEMLLLAALARARYAPQASLVYESLDIHRLLLAHGLAGKGIRLVERALLRKSDLLIVSSPAFLREYYARIQRVDGRRDLQCLLVENKLLAPSFGAAVPKQPELPAGPPWRLGWYGMIRCRKSLDYLCDLAARRPALLSLAIRGRPSYTEFADFDAQIARTPGVSFGGAYRPDELGALYGGVHFNWAIDLFEEGANSRWLLPNRIYEGGAFEAVPIALEGTETAGWLWDRGVGLVLPSIDAFETFLSELTAERYAALKAASRALPKAAVIADDGDCRRLRDALVDAQARRRGRLSRSGARLFEASRRAKPGDAAPEARENT